MMVSKNVADIAENRQGRLSQAQIAAYEQELSRTRRWGWVAPFLFVTFVVASAILTHTHSTAGFIAFAIIEAVSLLLIIRFMRWVATRARSNMLADRVEYKTGLLSYIRRSQFLPPRYYLRFGGEPVLSAPVKVIKPIRKQLEEHPHRVYFLSRLGNIVAIEPENDKT